MVQAARHYATGVNEETHGGSPEQLAVFNLRQREAGIERYLARTDEAKVALVAVSLYFPDVEDWLGELEFPEDQDVKRRQQLQAARVPATRSERLWKRRKKIERVTPPCASTTGQRCATDPHPNGDGYRARRTGAGCQPLGQLMRR